MLTSLLSLMSHCPPPTYPLPLLQDCEEGLLLGWMLTKNWDEMAKHFVDLNGKMTHEEKKELILSRLRPTLSRVRAGCDSTVLSRPFKNC